MMKKTICVCLSFRFYNEYLEIKKQLEAEGLEVFGPEYHPRIRNHKNPKKFFLSLPEAESEIIAKEAERSFLQKIDKADVVYILARDGYVGLSVSMEIGYAYHMGKPIFSSDVLADFVLRGLISDVMAPEELSD